MRCSLLVLFAALICVGPIAAGPKKTPKDRPTLPTSESVPQIRIGDPTPGYLPAVPEFPYPLTRELAYQEEIAGVISPKMVVKVYPVADLVVAPPPVGSGAALPEKVRTKEVELIDGLTKKVAPKSWTKAGGKGSVEFFPLGLALVVSQTPEVHEVVTNYLETLRKAQDQQVSTQVLLLTVSNEWFERSELKKELAATKAGKPGDAVVLKCRSAKEVEKLLASCQDDRASSVMQSPRITTLNGQAGQIKVDSAETFVTGVSVEGLKDGCVVFTPKQEKIELGVAMTVEPTVSSDGKEIGIRFTGSVKELAELPVRMTPISTMIHPVFEDGKKGEPVPFTQFIQHPKPIARQASVTLRVPDSGTAVVYGGSATIEQTVREALPIFADTPVLCKLFVRERKETQNNHLIVLVSSKVVAPEVLTAGFEECQKCDPKLSKLLGEYAHACKAGKVEEARRLAIECLVIDPTCFARR